VVTAGGIAAGLFGGEPRDVLGSRGGIAVSKPSGNKRISGKATVYAARRGSARFEAGPEFNLR
jgi:hypothetical protein